MGCGASAGPNDNAAEEKQITPQGNDGSEEEPILECRVLDADGDDGPQSPVAKLNLSQIHNKGWICEHYDVDKDMLYRGGATLVFKAWSNKTGKIHAVKRCEFRKPPEEKQTKSEFFVQSAQHKEEARLKISTKPTIEEEVALLHRMREHPNIIRLYETFSDVLNFFFVVELCEGGTLYDQIVDGDALLDEREASTVMRQTLRAVHFMHNHGVIHRDLRSEHVMLKHNGILRHCQIKVIDFSSAALFQPGQYFQDTDIGTPFYNSPQLIGPMSGQYTQVCDIYSCGVIMYVALLGFPGFLKNRPKTEERSRPSTPGVRGRQDNSGDSLDDTRKPWSPGGCWATPPPDMRLREQDMKGLPNESAFGFGPELQRSAHQRQTSKISPAPSRLKTKSSGDYVKERFVFSPIDVKTLTRDAQEFLGGLLHQLEERRWPITKALDHEWINRHAKQAWNKRSIRQPRQPPSNAPPSLRIKPESRSKEVDDDDMFYLDDT